VSSGPDESTPTGTDHVTRPVDTASAAVEVTDVAAALDAAVHDPSVRRGLVRRLHDRFAHLLHELGKFGTVGSITLVVDVAIFNVLRNWGMESLISATISMAVAATLAFVGNRFWTWRHRERSGLHREYVLYFVFNAIGLLISLACLAISTYGLGAVWPVFASRLAENISKQIVGGGLGTVFRFWSYRTIVFREKRQ
jgi:putative flippase GtrA